MAPLLSHTIALTMKLSIHGITGVVMNWTISSVFAALSFISHLTTNLQALSGLIGLTEKLTFK